jgi:hypothetical protein
MREGASATNGASNHCKPAYNANVLVDRFRSGLSGQFAFLPSTFTTLFESGAKSIDTAAGLSAIRTSNVALAFDVSRSNLRATNSSDYKHHVR